MIIEPKIINNTYYYTVVIVHIYMDFSEILKDGKWVKSKEEKYEDIILTFDKGFHTEEDAKKFIETNKSFKSILKIVQKGNLI